MSIDRWVDTEIVVQTYSGIWLSYKKKKNAFKFSPNDVNEHRAYYTEWSK